jgi:hypothetical protein
MTNKAMPARSQPRKEDDSIMNTGRVERSRPRQDRFVCNLEKYSLQLGSRSLAFADKCAPLKNRIAKMSLNRIDKETSSMPFLG